MVNGKSLVEVIGWIGAAMLSLCALPQCYKCWRTKKTKDLDWYFLWMWAIGISMMFIHVLCKDHAKGEYQWPLLCNYVFSLIAVCYLLYAKLRY